MEWQTGRQRNKETTNSNDGQKRVTHIYIFVLINRQSLVRTFNISSNLLSLLTKVPHINVGNLKRAKVPSSPKGKLGCAHLWKVNTTHTISEQNSLKSTYSCQLSTVSLSGITSLKLAKNGSRSGYINKQTTTSRQDRFKTEPKQTTNISPYPFTTRLWYTLLLLSFLSIPDNKAYLQISIPLKTVW